MPCTAAPDKAGTAAAADCRIRAALLSLVSVLEASEGCVSPIKKLPSDLCTRHQQQQPSNTISQLHNQTAGMALLSHTLAVYKPIMPNRTCCRTPLQRDIGSRCQRSQCCAHFVKPTCTGTSLHVAGWNPQCPPNDPPCTRVAPTCKMNTESVTTMCLSSPGCKGAVSRMAAGLCSKGSV